MRHPLVPTPMPVVLSRDAAAEQYGVGSELHRIAAHFDPPPPPSPEEQAVLDRTRAEWEAWAERCRVANALSSAFLVVGQCIALVEAHAGVLFDADEAIDPLRWGCAMVSYRHARDLAFASLALLFERSPELLPIGPAVHADCGWDDR